MGESGSDEDRGPDEIVDLSREGEAKAIGREVIAKDGGERLELLDGSLWHVESDGRQEKRWRARDAAEMHEFVSAWIDSGDVRRVMAHVKSRTGRKPTRARAKKPAEDVPGADDRRSRSPSASRRSQPVGRARAKKAKRGNR